MKNLKNEENKKSNLLSIGELSKFTGAGVQSLRYYERMKLLEPAYIDSETKYRYYTFEQGYLVEIIRICIELDIPLKVLTKFVSGEDEEAVNYLSLLNYGEEIMQEKMAVLEKGLRFIRGMKEEISILDSYGLGQYYTREISQCCYYIMPYEKIAKDKETVGIVKASPHLYCPENYFPEFLFSRFLEYGVLYEYTIEGVQPFLFTELPSNISTKITSKLKNIMIIPAGTYHCMQNEKSQIEQAGEIFSEYLHGRKSFLAIENSIFTGYFKLNKPVNELKVIVRESS